MKLIDILVQELPKRGGWPDGIEEIWQDYDKLIRAGAIGWFHDVLSEDHRRQHHDAHVKVNRKQYEAALAASKVSVWDGEGLPPVGCECEWHDRNTKSWIPVKVLYSSEWVVVIRGMATNGDIVELGVEVYGDTARCKFRPIRTEAERKREDAINFMKSKFREITHPCADKVSGQEAVFAAVYDAISAGKMPGVKLEGS